MGYSSPSERTHDSQFNQISHFVEVKVRNQPYGSFVYRSSPEIMPIFGQLTYMQPGVCLHCRVVMETALQDQEKARKMHTHLCRAVKDCQLPGPITYRSLPEGRRRSIWGVSQRYRGADDSLSSAMI